MQMAKVKIPKRIAGVKIPKKVRKKANRAIKLAESPIAREVAAAALGAVAGRATDAEGGSDGRRHPGRTRRIDGDRLAEVIRAAAAEGIRRFVEGFEEGIRKGAAVADPEEDREPADESERSRANGS